VAGIGQVLCDSLPQRIGGGLQAGAGIVDGEGFEVGDRFHAVAPYGFGWEGMLSYLTRRKNGVISEALSTGF